MPKSYQHLTYAQRCQIFVLNERKEKQSEIARIVGVHKSTVCRELARNAKENSYNHDRAQSQSQERRRKPLSKADMNPELFLIIEEKLRMKWSPVQISGWLKRNGLGEVSHETIYKHVWADKKSGGELYKHLRRRGKKYNRRGGSPAGRGCIPNRIDIKERPAVVEEKSRIGDWEIDTIIGANHNGAIVSMVDRATKFTKLSKVSFKTAEEVGNALITALSPIKDVVLTLTADNGKEFSKHVMIGQELGATVYFATPYHSWERGLNEHTNGMVRQYFPKGLQFDGITEKELMEVEQALNDRPRKVLSFETPREAFQRLSGK